MNNHRGAPAGHLMGASCVLQGGRRKVCRRPHLHLPGFIRAPDLLEVLDAALQVLEPLRGAREGRRREGVVHEDAVDVPQ